MKTDMPPLPPNPVVMLVAPPPPPLLDVPPIAIGASCPLAWLASPFVPPAPPKGRLDTVNELPVPPLPAHDGADIAIASAAMHARIR
ncbi:hypothetical protein ACL598_02865 [Bordetella bronchialis]|uniref:hypothetical protein n=1 Tax=Bordetella bronchialis TaxID=463025 RepID=UPI003D093888